MYEFGRSRLTKRPPFYFARYQLGKVKNKDHNELRYLKGVIRELQKEVRTLRKELQYYKKRHYDLEDNDQDVELSGDSEDTFVEIEVTKRGPACLECGKGTYEEFEIMGKTYGTCTVCEHRKRLK